MTRIFFTSILLFIAAAVSAQQIAVQGTVLSKSDDEPLIGASVIADGTDKGVTTDYDGHFTITVEKGTKLTVSYVGYHPQTVEAKPEITIYLDDNTALLDEVVVVGYQVQRKADLTGSVAVMNMKEPLSENSGNIMNFIQLSKVE